ncbi:MAG TPA: glycosyltransferase family 2 protein, partial [Saprospiraceae bacterium]|nr:glycosyltransferase family 2 protein [Saprospiraceae bacterium]
MPAISIVIPTYNGAEYLCECLDSVLDQSYTDFEIIIVDDTSKDATLKIAREYAHRDKRITIHENSINLGLVGNWNRCVEIARADWIKFVFQDDYLYPDCLRALYEAARPEVGVAGCVRKILFDGVSDKVRAEYELLQRDHSIENLVANSEVISADN